MEFRFCINHIWFETNFIILCKWRTILPRNWSKICSPWWSSCARQDQQQERGIMGWWTGWNQKILLLLLGRSWLPTEVEGRRHSHPLDSGQQRQHQCGKSLNNSFFHRETNMNRRVVTKSVLLSRWRLKVPEGSHHKVFAYFYQHWYFPGLSITSVAAGQLPCWLIFHSLLVSPGTALLSAS